MFCVIKLKLFLLIGLYALIKSTYTNEFDHIKCKTQSDCSLLKNSFCDLRTQRCECYPTHQIKYYNGQNLFCLKAAAIGEQCNFSVSCHYFDSNTICHRRHVCICNSGFQLKKDPNNQKLCVDINNFNPDFQPISDFSDEFDDSDEDDKKRRSYEKDIVVPIIVGIVLGSLILCCWSFAICRLYLKKLERQRARSRRKRIVKQNFQYEDSNTRRVPESSGRTVPFTSLYSLVPCSRDPSSATPDVPQENIPFLAPASAIPLISPNEEPLPGYERSPSKNSDNEPPPSYDEVMRGAKPESE